MEVFELIKNGILNDELSFFVFQLISALFIIDLVLYILIWSNLLGLNAQIKNGQMYKQPLRGIINGFEELIDVSTHQVNTGAYIDDFFSRYKITIIPFVNIINLPVISTIKFIKNTVSLFILIGVLGTFIGIYSSLVQLLNMEMTGELGFIAGIESIGPVLSGMGTAFATSIVGMGFALLTTLFLKVFNAEQFLTGIMVRLENYLDNEIKRAKKSMLSQQFNQLNRTINTGFQNLSVCLDDILASVQGFNQFSAQFEEAAVSMESFNHGLTDSMQDLQKFYQTNKEFTKGFQADISHLSEKIDLLANSIESLSQQEQELENFINHNKKLQQKNLQVLDELSQDLDQSRQQLETEMQKLVSKADQHQQQLSDKYEELLSVRAATGENLDQAAETLVRKIASIQQDFRQELSKDVNSFAEHVDISTKVISSGFDSLENKFNEMDNVLGKYLHGLAYNTNDLEHDLQHLNDIATAIKENIKHQTTAIDKFNQVIEKIDSPGAGEIDET